MNLSGPTPLRIDQNGRTIEEGYRNIESDSATVATSGTPVQLASAYTEVKRVDINNPNTSNGAVLYIGSSNVSSTKGIPLYPNTTYTLYITDLSQMWVDASANNATVQYNYFW